MKKGLEVALAALAVSVAAQGADKTLEQELVGTWTIVADTFEGGGNKIEVFGPHPKGSMILGADGHFAVVITRGDVARFAANNRMKGTPEENAAAVQGGIGYFGTWTVNEGEKALVLHVDSSTYPNWIGSEQKRIVQIQGDEMHAINPTPSVGTGTAQVVWRRAKQAPMAAGEKK